MPDAERPLGILGGTFDPVHLAHVHLARAALDQLRLGSVLWVPAGMPSHRQPPLAPAADRLAMVRLVAATDPRFAVDAADALTTAPSFTVPLLERLRQHHGTARPLVLLMGADAFLGLPSWLRWQEIFGLAHIAIAARPGAELDVKNMAPELVDQFQRRQRSQFTALATAPAGCIAGFAIEPVEPPDLSATAVRSLLRTDPAAADNLLPPGVLDYIRRNHLYTD